MNHSPTQPEPKQDVDSKSDISADSQSLWRSARFLLAMEMILFILQLAGSSNTGADPPIQTMPQWLQFVVYLASVPIAFIAQPIILLIALVETYRAQGTGDGRTIAATSLAAFLSFVGMLLLLHMLSRAYG